MYTSCPECGTVFRITTQDLRVAEGHVRCGHCSATFNAVASLSDALPPDAVAVPPPEPAATTPPVGVQATAHRDDTLEFDIPEGNWSSFFRDELLSKNRQEPLIADSPAEPTGSVDLPAEDRDSLAAPPEPPAPDADDDDDWQALLDEVQDEVQDDNAVTDSVYIIDADTPQEMPEQSVPEPSAPAGNPWDESAVEATGTPAPLPADFAATLTGGGTAADTDRPGSDADRDGGRTAPEMPDGPATYPPFAWTPPERIAAVKPRRRWIYATGSLLLALTLVIQLLHQQRDELATNPSFTEPLQRVYGALGIPLWPAWDLRAYELRNYEAVADRSKRGALDILARIVVVGDDRVGLPLVRVTITDRYGQSMGSRVFGPDEYLGKNARLREPVSPGTLIPVEISLKDPGRDAQGFDVDICLISQRDGMTCQSEREPFAR
ncbi:MAG: zinc-ribbon domain-containing protein [Gammaproteobacteria bacterium]|nr:zinc-ribbon domain-containing protein [Gammaproteobacteria bacterium]